MKKAISLSNRLKNRFVYRGSSKYRRHSPSTTYQLPSTKSGFTIVELLVVIVVIGILAAITIVSYIGIANKATLTSLTSDLDNASRKLKMYYVDNGAFPTGINIAGDKCPTGPTDPRYCLKTSTGNTFSTYTPAVGSSPQSYTLDATNGTTVYRITNDSTPVIVASLAVTDPANWLAIGTQVWAKANLNVGTRIAGVTAQANNATKEKYCYSDTESNCTTYGGLYQWNEAMQYVTTEGAHGICPTGSHIPSDNDWKILEMQLGMSQEDADATGWRGTDQGTQLQPGGASGLNLPLAGYRGTAGTFGDLPSVAHLWSSSESGADAWVRALYYDDPTVLLYPDDKGYGFSVRCMGN